MSLPEIGGLLRRHLLAVLAVLIVTAGAAFYFKHAAPAYTETGTLAFQPPVSGGNPNPLEAGGSSIIEAAGVAAFDIMSPQGQQRVLAGGGAAQVDVQLYNSYDLEYPNYSTPYLILTSTSTDPNAVHRTFTVAQNLLTKDFLAQQGTTPNNRIQIELAGDTGPLIQSGQPKRELGGLAILCVVAIFGVASFLERHPIRLGRLFGSRAAQLNDKSWAQVPLRQPGTAGPVVPD